MDDFEGNITKSLTELELQKTASNEINTEIKKLFKLKKTIEQFSTSIFVHRPFPLSSQNNISAEKITSLVELISGKGKCSTKYDILLYMKFRLAKLPNISSQELNLMKTIPKELQDEILKRLNKISITELARKYDIPYYTLYYWIKKQGITVKKTSEFPLSIQQELREKCHTSSLKTLAKEYGLSEQTMGSRLKDIRYFSDGKGSFLIVDVFLEEKILSCFKENGIAETAKKFHTTQIAIKSFFKKQVDNT